jgi:hypothetical protein
MVWQIATFLDHALPPAIQPAMKKNAKQPGGGARSRLLRDCAAGLKVVWRRKLWLNLGRDRTRGDAGQPIETGKAIPERSGRVHSLFPSQCDGISMAGTCSMGG